MELSNTCTLQVQCYAKLTKHRITEIEHNPVILCSFVTRIWTWLLFLVFSYCWNNQLQIFSRNHFGFRVVEVAHIVLVQIAVKSLLYHLELTHIKFQSCFSVVYYFFDALNMYASDEVAVLDFLQNRRPTKTAGCRHFMDEVVSINQSISLELNEVGWFAVWIFANKLCFFNDFLFIECSVKAIAQTPINLLQIVSSIQFN